MRKTSVMAVSVTGAQVEESRVEFNFHQRRKARKQKQQDVSCNAFASRANIALIYKPHFASDADLTRKI